LETTDNSDTIVEFITTKEYLDNSSYYEKQFAEIQMATDILKMKFMILSEKDLIDANLNELKINYALNKRAIANKCGAKEAIAA
jgi:hypothetical protein